MITNGKVTGDKVGSHGDLLDEFPYLGPPHDWQPLYAAIQIEFGLNNG